MKITAKLKYKKDTKKITPPILRHTDKRVIVDSAFVMEVGQHKDGSQYQIIKIHTHESQLDF